MEPAVVDNEFDKIWRSVNAKFKSGYGTCTSTSTCQRRTHPQSAKPMGYSVDVPASSWLTVSTSPEHSHQSDKNLSTETVLDNNETRLDGISLGSVIARLDRKKPSVSELVQNWKDLHPDKLMEIEGGQSPSPSYMAAETANDSDEENIPSRRNATRIRTKHFHLSSAVHDDQCCEESMEGGSCSDGFSQYTSPPSFVNNEADVNRQMLNDEMATNERGKNTSEVASEVSSRIENNHDPERASEQCPTDSEDNISVTKNMKLKPSEVAITEIENWAVQLYEHGIRIEGHRLMDTPGEFWHTSDIVKRLSSHLVQTSSGSIYRLVGEMDSEELDDEDSLAVLFKNGFPSRWKMLVKEYQKTKLQKSADDKNVKKQSERSKPRSQRGTKLSKNVAAPSLSTVLEKTTGEVNKLKTKTGRRKPKCMPLKKNCKLLNNTLLSFSGVLEAGTDEDPLVLDKLPRTRSGRLVIPPLSYWTGQRIQIHPETQKVNVVSGGPNFISGELSFSFQGASRQEIKTTAKPLTKKQEQTKKKRSYNRQLFNKDDATKHVHKQHRQKAKRSKKTSLISCHKPNGVKKGRKKLDIKQVMELSQITAGVGTLKRRRQLRQLIANHKKDTWDDVYESIPESTNKGRRGSRFNSVICSNALSGIRTPVFHKETAKPMDTDCLETPCNRPEFPVPVSQKKSPSVLFSSDLSAEYDRNDVDGYLYKMKKTLRGRQWGIVPNKMTSKKVQQCRLEMKIIPATLDPDLLKPVDKVDEEDSDYYFSD